MTPTPAANRRLVVFCLFLTYFVFAILLNSVGTVIAQAMRSFGIDEPSAAVLEPCKDLPIALISLTLAAFLPRFGYRRSMLTGLGLVSLACLAMPLVPGFWTTKLLFATIGLAFGLVKVSAYSTIGLITTSKAEHASTMSTMEGVFQTGTFAGYWIFSLFIGAGAAAAGAGEATRDWLNTYWLLSAICAVAFVILLLTRFDESAARRRHGERLRDLFLAKWGLLARSVTLVFVASAFLYVFIEQGIQTWLPRFNETILFLPAAMSVQAASIYAVCLAAGRLGAGVLMRRFNWFGLLMVCLVMMAVLIVLSMTLTRGLAPMARPSWADAPLAAWLFPLIGLFMAPIYPTIVSVILSAFAQHRHAAMSGLIVIFSALGGTTGSVVTAVVFKHFSGQTAFTLTLIPLGLLAVTLFFFHRKAEACVDDEEIEEQGLLDAEPTVVQTEPSPGR